MFGINLKQQRKTKEWYKNVSSGDRPDKQYELLFKLIADAKHMNEAGEKEIELQKIDIVIKHLENMKK